MHVLLPECLTEGKAKTLYLLHGMSDNEGLWMRRTSIDRYAAAKNLAVIMPDGGLGWYTEHALRPALVYICGPGAAALCGGFSPSLRPAGGYLRGRRFHGRLRGAEVRPARAGDVFARHLPFRGAGRRRHRRKRRRAGPAEFLGGCVRPGGGVPGSENDLFTAAEALRDSPLRPSVYMWCGTEDFLYNMSARMRGHLCALGYDLTYEESPGDHQWLYWDKKIVDALDWLVPEEEGNPWR